MGAEPGTHMKTAVDLTQPLEGVVYERRDDGIAIITLDRPGRGNALAPGMQRIFRAIWSTRLKP